MLDARRRFLLGSMGIDVWRARGANSLTSVETEAMGENREPRDEVTLTPVVAGSAELESPAVHLAPSNLEPRAANLGWEELRSAVKSCTGCPLHQTRTQTVFGVGSETAELMIVGEAPGADEDRQGEPFVGRAGQLLNAMLAAIGLQRQQVYIANIIKCRPPGNRDPHRDEADACRDYLLRQVALIRPRVVLSVGRVSAHNLLGCDDPVGRLRGRTHRFEPGDIPLIVTYHPAYLLRRPEEKAKAWTDLQAVARQLDAS